MDTQYFHSVAASIKNSNGPPKTPGTSTEELRYHFGPYAPAAAISRLDGLELGDAFARVTRGGSLWRLVLSCFGLGTLLSLKANGGKFGGVMSVTGLFLRFIAFPIHQRAEWVQLRDWSHPFRDSQRHSSRRWRALQPSDPRAFNATRLRSCYSDHGGMPDSKGAGNIPKLARVHIGGAACVRCLSELGGCPLLPGHSMHSLVLGRLGEARSWLSITLMLGLFLGAWHLMGYSHSPDMTGATINRHPETYWWWAVMCFTVGLGSEW